MSVFSVKLLFRAALVDTEQTVREKGQGTSGAQIQLLASAQFVFLSISCQRDNLGLALFLVRFVLVLKVQFQINFTSAVLAVLTTEYGRHFVVAVCSSCRTD